MAMQLWKRCLLRGEEKTELQLNIASSIASLIESGRMQLWLQLDPSFNATRGDIINTVDFLSTIEDTMIFHSQ